MIAAAFRALDTVLTIRIVGFWASVPGDVGCQRAFDRLQATIAVVAALCHGERASA